MPTPPLTRDERMIRREIPAMTCRPNCADCCGPVPWSPTELARVADQIPPGTVQATIRGATVLVDPHRPWRCPFRQDPGGCAVYENRPLMCRLFGTAPAAPQLRCPHGCKPDRPLAPQQAARLRDRYARSMEQDR